MTIRAASLWGLGLCLVGGMAAAQVGLPTPAPTPVPRTGPVFSPGPPATPSPFQPDAGRRDGRPDAFQPMRTPGINRNPIYRDNLPVAPEPQDSSRAVVPTQPGPCDPRDSTTRPVRTPDGIPCVR